VSSERLITLGAALVLGTAVAAVAMVSHEINASLAGLAPTELSRRAPSAAEECVPILVPSTMEHARTLPAPDAASRISMRRTFHVRCSPSQLNGTVAAASRPAIAQRKSPDLVRSP
jgi:hypothetical protein